MKLMTHLISGAGNSFHILNQFNNGEMGETQKWPIEKKKDFVKKVCKKNLADGFIFLKTTKDDTELEWDFYNNDGSDAEMCGNATRCVGLYMSEILGSKNSKWILRTSAGPIQIEKIKNDQYKIIMTPIKILKSTRGFFCDTGVPHLVCEIADFSKLSEHKAEAQVLRNDPEFQPKGTNVTYVQLLPQANQVKAVSYERGVEDFTQACGTGAMAAAAFNLMKRSSIETQVEMPGGTLMMSLADLKQPSMIGPANLLGKYEYEISNE